jgi:hypothetical protein
MFKIEPAPFGFRVTSSGCFTIDDIEQLKFALLQTLSAHDRPFSLLLDSRRIIPPPPDVMKEFWDLHSKVWQLSCERIAFVVSSPVAKAQVLQMHHTASSGKQDRVIDASRSADWEERAVAWALNAKEPDESPVLSQEKLK